MGGGIMAKDDYYVIVYKILAYLYDCLKQGEEPQSNMIAYNGSLFHIHPRCTFPIGD